MGEVFAKEGMRVSVTAHVAPLLTLIYLSTCMAFISSVVPVKRLSAVPVALRAERSGRERHVLWAMQGSSQQATLNAKADLIDVVLSTSKFGTDLSEDVASRVESLIESLASQKKGFDRSTADGNWALIYEINSDGSPALQKLSQNFESVGGSFANFDVSKNKFYNIASLFGGKGELQATVEFGEADTSETSRISCDIIDASIQFKPLPALPLPLRAKGGWLDFLYLDQDLRITRGNRGGLFIHIRPDLLESTLSKA